MNKSEKIHIKWEKVFVGLPKAVDFSGSKYGIKKATRFDKTKTFKARSLSRNLPQQNKAGVRKRLLLKFHNFDPNDQILFDENCFVSFLPRKFSARRRFGLGTETSFSSDTRKWEWKNGSFKEIKTKLLAAEINCQNFSQVFLTKKLIGCVTLLFCRN